jgi:hypothetical protein
MLCGRGDAAERERRRAHVPWVATACVAVGYIDPPFRELFGLLAGQRAFVQTIARVTRRGLPAA